MEKEDIKEEVPAPVEAEEAPAPAETEEGETPAPEETDEAQKKRDFKFKLAFLGSFCVALLSFFIALCFGKVYYGVAAYAFAGISIQIFDFYLNLNYKRVPLLVTGCLSAAASLTMLVLSIVAAVVG